MLLAQHGVLGVPGRDFFVVGLVGDSNVIGQGEVAGPTTLPGTCYEWNDGTGLLVELTTADLSSANVGTAWKAFALYHNQSTGKKIVFVQGAVNGSSFYPNVAGGITNNWMATPDGACYEPFVAKMTNCLNYLGKNQPDLIAGALGINDEQGSVTTANFITGVNAVFTQLDTTYPGVQKLWTQIGRWASGTNTTTLYDKRYALVSRIEAFATHAMAFSNLACVFSGTGYRADNVHLAQASLNSLGFSYSEYLRFTHITNKWARGAIASFFYPLTPAVQTAMADYITTLYADGMYFTSEGSVFLKASNLENISVDVTFRNSGAKVGGTFTANSYLRLDGVDDYYATGITPSFYDGGWSQDDHFFTVKLLTNRDLASVAGGLFGAGNNSAPFMGIAQNGSNQLNYRANDNTVSVIGTPTKLQDNKFYGVARNGTTKYLLDSTTVLASVVQASTGLGARDILIGCWNTAGTPAVFLDCDVEFYYAGKYTTLNANLYTKAQAVLDAF